MAWVLPVAEDRRRKSKVSGAHVNNGENDACAQRFNREGPTLCGRRREARCFERGIGDLVSPSSSSSCQLTHTAIASVVNPALQAADVCLYFVHTILLLEMPCAGPS